MTILTFSAVARRLARRCVALLLACAGAAPVHAQGFDYKLLEGEWAESVRNGYGCRPDNLHFRLAVSADHTHLDFVLDRPWRIGRAAPVQRYGAAIVSESPTMLVIRYDDSVAGIPANMREWEMLFIGPGTYRWRATFWRRGEYNDVVGVKCGP